MSNCTVCGKPAWNCKERFFSLYCESCRIADVAEEYVNNLAIKWSH